MAEKVTVTGRISRVETKFAYINTSRGSVFCPLAAAIPPTDNVPNFSIRYGVGDLVHVTMVPQDGKNGCYWRAVKSAIITNVSETLAYGHSDKLGSIFIPGAAFSSEEVTRLNSYLNLGDEVIVSIRPQTDVNGCKWIAVSATKKKKSKQPHITGTSYLSCLPSDNMADEGDPCLVLFECSVQPPKCLRITAIPPDLVPVMKYLLVKFREYEQNSL
ncbi:unnamed protein product [Heligmosomoides polygyrus]|uniref:Exosome complex component CSL4 n=1 Tax=Heligmosomoides polygyrus TaxID=6339 RepID=A0A183GAJ6_HELPZ|nr:unnamed protein product [Heligmosomoides polygyrus]